MAMIMSKTMFPVRSAPIIPISLAVESMLGPCVCAPRGTTECIQLAYLKQLMIAVLQRRAA